jgi:hypothetical protein
MRTEKMAGKTVQDKQLKRWPLYIRLIVYSLKLCMRHRVIGAENITEEPAVFVANHGEFYGPVALSVFMPVYFRPWVDERMVNKEKCFAHIYHGTFENIRWMPKGAKRLLTHICAAFISRVFSDMNSIPVYRDSLKDLAKTFTLSAEALLKDNVLVFPENPGKESDGKYKTDGSVSDFFTGFVHIGTVFYKKTGRCVTFYPVYADKAKKTLTIYPGILFNGEANSKEEKQRIAEEIRQRMLQDN